MHRWDQNLEIRQFKCGHICLTEFFSYSRGVRCLTPSLHLIDIPSDIVLDDYCGNSNDNGKINGKCNGGNVNDNKYGNKVEDPKQDTKKLFDCVTDDNLSLLKALVDCGKGDVNAIDENGRSLLHKILIEHKPHMLAYILSVVRGDLLVRKDYFGNEFYQYNRADYNLSVLYKLKAVLSEPLVGGGIGNEIHIPTNLQDIVIDFCLPTAS